VRYAVLAVLAVDVAFVAAGVLGQPAYLHERDSAAYLVEAVVMLAVYGVLTVLLTRRVSAGRVRVLRVAGLTGLVLGTVEAVNISVETFAGLSGALGLVPTAPLVLGPFLVWSVLSGWSARVSGSSRVGVLAALWCAMVTMVVGVTFGFLLALIVPGRLAALLLDSPEFQRSGWSDVHAFVLANTFDNGFTHLLGGLVVASLVGVVGAVVGTGQTQPRPAGQGSAGT